MSGNSVIVPVTVMRPIFPLVDSVNQRLPSGPEVIWAGWLFIVGILKIFTLSVVAFMTAMLFFAYSQNQMLPSGPVVMPLGWLFNCGMVFSVKLDVNE